MAKIDLDKLICSLAKRKYFSEEKLQDALKEQGLEYKDGEIVEAQKPKFHEGEWIKHNKANFIFKINKVTANKYEFENSEGYNHSLPIKSVDEKYHLWTIEDAKDGDVLVDVYGNIGIFEKHDDFDWTSYCSLGVRGGFQSFKVEHENEKTYPATKEQRDLLFAKMKEAGYEWDAEKKKLKKRRKPLYGRGDIIEYKGCPYFIEEVVTPKENIFYYNVVSLCFGEKLRKSIGEASEKDIILISNNRFDYEQADIQQKDYSPKEDEELFFGDFRKTDSEDKGKASFANRQVYNRAILAILSNYVEKYPDIRFGQMLFNLDIKPHFDEESREAYCNLNETINKKS